VTKMETERTTTRPAGTWRHVAVRVFCGSKGSRRRRSGRPSPMQSKYCVRWRGARRRPA
jgi:hypothetical protein